MPEDIHPCSSFRPLLPQLIYRLPTPAAGRHTNSSMRMLQRNRPARTFLAYSRTCTTSRGHLSCFHYQPLPRNIQSPRPGDYTNNSYQFVLPQPNARSNTSGLNSSRNRAADNHTSHRTSPSMQSQPAPSSQPSTMFPLTTPPSLQGVGKANCARYQGNFLANRLKLAR